MQKIKYLAVALGFVCLVGLGTLTYLIWNKNKSNQILGFFKPGDGTSSQNSQVLSSNQNSETSGLQIAQNGSTDGLGQLTPDKQQSQDNNNQSSSSSSNNAAKILDPTTFKQYDSHKNENAPLFKDLLVGDGDTLTANKKAAVFYKVWLTDGTLVDASRPGSDGQLQPFTFTLGAHQVIAGWDQGMAGMKVGGVRFLIVPPSVGYGNEPKGNIPANSVLVFQVQLAAVE